MKPLLIFFFILLILSCLIVIALQLRATYTGTNRKAEILRSIVAGLALNIALLSISFLKSALISHSPAPIRESLPEEFPILILQVLFSLIFYGIFEFRNKIRRHLSEFDKEYGEKES